MSVRAACKARYGERPCISISASERYECTDWCPLLRRIIPEAEALSAPRQTDDVTQPPKQLRLL